MSGPLAPLTRLAAPAIADVATMGLVRAGDALAAGLSRRRATRASRDDARERTEALVVEVVVLTAALALAPTVAALIARGALRALRRRA